MRRSIAGLLDAACERHPDEPAVACAGSELTFGELREQARTVAAGLAETGVAPGDRVGVSMRSSLEQVVAILGTILADAVLVPVLPRLHDAGVAHIARDAQLRVIVADPARRDTLAQACPGTAVVAGTPPLRELGGSPRPPAAGGPDTAALLYSSGSTGFPKGVVVSHDNIVLGAEIVAGYLGTRREDRIGGLLSLNSDYGLNQLWQALLTGASLHLHDLVLPRSALEMLAAEGITALPLMPALVQRLFGTRATPRVLPDLSAVRYVTSTGGPISSWALATVREAFPRARIFLMYGLTEAFRSSYLDPDAVERLPTSVGRAIPGVRLHVVDDAGRECAPGEVGTLVHRGGCIAKGYWNDPAATARTFRRLDRFPGETVVWTHDLARKDAEGNLFIVGRSDFLIKRDGYRIGPGEIESVAGAHPAVSEAIAVGLPDGDRGQRVVLAWTGRPGADGAGELEAWLARNLPSHMVPAELVRFDAFPVIAGGGKFDRARVAARVAG